MSCYKHLIMLCLSASERTYVKNLMYFIYSIKCTKLLIIFMNVLYWNLCILYVLQCDIAMHNCAALIIIIVLKFETTRRIQKIIKPLYMKLVLICSCNYHLNVAAFYPLITTFSNITVYAPLVVSTICEIYFCTPDETECQKINCITSFLFILSNLPFDKIAEHFYQI